MIQVGALTVPLDDPLVWAVGGLFFCLLFLLMILIATRRAGRAARATERMLVQVAGLGRRVQSLSDGQQQLFGGLGTVSEAQAQQQAYTLHHMEERFSEVTHHMQESLQVSARRTARSLGELQQRLETIDKAQAKIEALSGNVLSLQDILSNKQTRGAFGEIQLHDIVGAALPPDSFTWQATLSNGKRPDCLIHLPDPPGPIAVDAKFPLDAYEMLQRSDTQTEQDAAERRMRVDLRAHIKAISKKYIIDGETADGAMMFLPSEAVFAELHANFPDIVREGFEARVWIVSPTTCMAVLHTMRAVLKDARMRAQAGLIRRELSLLFADVERLGTRVDTLDRHFGLAAKAITEIKISSDKVGRRARRLDAFDFEDLGGDPAADVVPLRSPES